MAIPPLDVRATWSGEELSTGALGAKADLEALGTAADTAAADINTSLASVGTTATTELGTTIPAAADTGLGGLTTRASKFKAVGTELGTSVAQGIGGGMSAPAAVANVAQSASGLLAPLASTGPGAIAAVGLGLGIAVVGNIVKGMTEEFAKSKAAVQDGANDLFGAIDVTAKTTLADIRRAIRDTFNLENVVAELGGEGGVTAGFEKINELVEITGFEFDTVVDAIRGKVTPATEAFYRKLVEVEDQGNKLSGPFSENELLMSDTAKAADEALDAINNTRGAIATGKDNLQQTRDYMQETAAAAEATAAFTAAIASNLGLAAGRAAAIAVDIGV